MILRNLIFAAILALVTLQCSPPEPELQTPLMQSNFTACTRNDQIVAFLNQCSLRNKNIHVEFFEVSGLQLPLVIIAKEKYFDKRLNVMLLGQQHGNEPSGMEGLLMLIREIATGNHKHLSDSLNLFILPQCNPWGGNHHERKNASGIDLNRDHMLMLAEETRIIQSVFEKYRPQMTVDFHEYYPYSKSWEDFGYRRNSDIQLGGQTNINIDSSLKSLFYREALPYTRKETEKHGFSFFEYTLGNFALGERLRHSTVDVNDGRQSFGITGVFAMIVEGMNGRDSLHRIEHRAKSQAATALALLQMAHSQKNQIMRCVNQAQKKLLAPQMPVAVRQDHFKGAELLAYPLLSLSTGNDTVFMVDEYHPLVKSLLDIMPPKGYLIPKTDTLLVSWLQRSNFHIDILPQEISGFFSYRILALNRSYDEEWENYYPDVKKVEIKNIKPECYFFIPTNQIYQHKIITALEPQAMYGLANYPEFEYLLNDEYFPVIRVE